MNQNTFCFFLDILYSNNQEIYLKLKEDKEDYILKHEKSVLQKNKIKESEIKKDQNNSEKLYKKYITCIEKKHIHAINDYDLLKNDLKKFITELDKSKLQNFIITNVLRDLEPIDNIQIFIDSFNVLNDIGKQNTKELLKPYRKKLIQALSFYEDSEFLKENLIEIKNEEIDELIIFVEENYSNLYSEHKIKNLFRFLQTTNKNIKSEILINIINSYEYNLHLSYEALKLYSKDYLDNEYLERLIRNYGSKLRTNRLDYNFIFEVNKILVGNNLDYAVDWLIENIKFNKYLLGKNPNYTNITRSVLNQEGVGRNIEFIKSFKYSDKLLELLAYGIELVHSDYNFYEFVNYEIWNPFQSYCSKLELNQKDYIQFKLKLTSLLENYDNKILVNWYKSKVNGILLDLKNKVTKDKVDISSSIQKYKSLEEKKYLDISYPKDVLEHIKEVLVEIKYEIKKGDYNYLYTNILDSKNEDYYEKFLMKEIELKLLRKGFRKNDLQEVSPKIYRQIQGFNNKRTDLLVFYGAIGTILIELKKEYNPLDLNYKETTLKNYMEFTYADFCICLVINDEENEISFDERIAKYKAELEDEIYSVIGLTFLTPPKKTKNT
ncbi:MAG: hypothetical protein IPQ19_15285 [Bacteroidetes bacterium]|nr:hypothetical protein [Bacteroidota bacterium]